MIFSIDAEDITVGDNLVVTVKVTGKVTHPDGRITIKFSQREPIIPLEVTLKANTTVSFEASSHPIKLV